MDKPDKIAKTDRNQELEKQDSDNMSSADSLMSGSSITNDTIMLPPGEALSLKESYELAAKEKTDFIVIAGPSGSGKTTLITGIYQLFQKGPIENLYFAGSQSLLAFENRVFLTRVISGQTTPDTPKSRRGILDMLHLKFFDSGTKDIFNLLISDFSGEDYSSVIANVDDAKNEFSTVQGARLFLVLLDGELISQKERRNSTLSETIQLIKTFIDAGLLSKGIKIIVVISKYDIIFQRREIDLSINGYIENIRKTFNDIENKYNIPIYIESVAAINNIPELDANKTLANLLKLIVDSIKIESKENNFISNDLRSQFNLYGLYRRNSKV